MFDVATLQKLKSIPTPYYFYDLDLLNRTLDELKSASLVHGYKVHYALKANSNDKILGLIKEAGFGADCGSGNEISKSIEIGFTSDEIVFAGVGKSDKEILTGLKNRIHSFNCESPQEIEIINQLAEANGAIANIALRLNPEVDAKTHKYITTGLQENKFGIYLRDLDDTLELISRLKNVSLIGLHFHIGSQVMNLDVFKSLCLRINEIQYRLRDRHIQLPHVNLGGGLGVDYEGPDENAIPDFAYFFDLIKNNLNPLPGQVVHFELGRSLVGQCGTLLSKVLYIKNGVATDFAILDAGITELIRPALYQAFHKIENLSSSKPAQKYDVVGPVCESSDSFGKAITLPATKRGDLMAIRSAGAYGEVMASRYNLRDLPRAVYSDQI